MLPHANNDIYGFFAGTRAQSVIPISPYVPTTTTNYIYDTTSDLLVPYYTSAAIEGSTSSIVALVSKSQQLPMPTPMPTIAAGSGDGIIPLSESSTSMLSPTTLPSPTSPPGQPEPTPDIMIKLRLTFSANITDQERMRIDQNLSLFIQDILQLTIPPVVSQEPGNTFNVLIVSSSSMDADVASGNISAVTALLAGVHANTLRVDVSQTSSLSNYIYRGSARDVM